VIVGTRQVLARAVATADTGRRHGRVGERLAIRGGASRPPGLSPRPARPAQPARPARPAQSAY
jgi:hypothetical protein